VSAAVLNSPGVRYSFGGLGLALTPDPSTGNLPGFTVVRRTTGRVLTGTGLLRSIQRSYDIQAAAIGDLNVTLEFGYRDGELSAPSLENTLSLLRSSAGNSGPWQGVPVSSRDISLNTVTTTGVTHFSVWTLGESSAPLPVELTSFTATPVANQTAMRLAWATASEKNSQAFEVERSLDGRTFTRIGTVAAASTSSSAHTYGLLDAQLPAGAALLYYRLRQVDLDGMFSYSPVHTVALTGAAAGLALYPRPTAARPPSWARSPAQ
jgi:hypothetical protein